MEKTQATKSVSDPPRATYQDVLNAPPNMVAEILDGKLHTQPRPGPPHGEAQIGLASRIGTPFHFGNGGPGGWRIHTEPELHLGEDILIPDLGGWRRERMPELPDTAYFALVPDWVCEIHSYRTREIDRGTKQKIYAREGGAFLWFADPEIRSIEAIKLQGTEWVLIDRLFDSASVSLPPFEAVSFNLGDLWSPVQHTIHKKTPKRAATEANPL